MAKILLVEDNRDLSATVVQYLTADRHTVEAVHDGTEASELLQLCQYDLVILDLMLPGMSGMDVCKQLRMRDKETPVLMLTSKAEISERVAGLDAGADDYLAKPFSVLELGSRVHALLRRSSGASANILQVADLQLDATKYKVTRGGVPLQLLPKEFALLEFLMRHPDQVFSLETLLARVWHTDSASGIEAVRTCLRRLRGKLSQKDDNAVIESVPRVGYRLKSGDK